MRADKKKKLETAGWTVGDAASFLELSSEEQAYVEMKLKLAEAIRERRRMLKWTQTVLANRINSSQSRIAKLEAGDPSISLDLVLRTFFALGTTTKDVARILQKETPRRATT